MVGRFTPFAKLTGCAHRSLGSAIKAASVPAGDTKQGESTEPGEASKDNLVRCQPHPTQEMPTPNGNLHLDSFEMTKFCSLGPLSMVICLGIGFWRYSVSTMGLRH